MTAEELLADLSRLGVRLEVRGDRLRYWPRSAVSDDLVGLMKVHKEELLRTVAEPPGYVFQCPWCRRVDLVDVEGGLWCSNCQTLAWLDQPDGGIARVDDCGVPVCLEFVPICGAEFPSIRTKTPPATILADKEKTCSRCGTSIVRAAPGARIGVCYYCWRIGN